MNTQKYRSDVTGFLWVEMRQSSVRTAHFKGMDEDNALKSNVLHDTGNCPYTCALLCLCHEPYSPTAPKWRIGFGDSMAKHRNLRAISERF
jgi:hypothetical protein